MQAHLSHRLVAGSVVATSALSVALFLAEAADMGLLLQID